MDYIAIIVIIIALFMLSGSEYISEKITANKILLILVIVYFVYNGIHFGILLILLCAYLMYDEDTRNSLLEYYYKFRDKTQTLIETPDSKTDSIGFLNEDLIINEPREPEQTIPEPVPESSNLGSSENKISG